MPNTMNIPYLLGEYHLAAILNSVGYYMHTRHSALLKSLKMAGFQNSAQYRESGVVSDLI